MANKKDTDKQSDAKQQQMMPDMAPFNDTIDQMKMAPDSVKNLTKSFDGMSSGMNRLTKSMDSLNTNFEKSAKLTNNQVKQQSDQANQTKQTPFWADDPKASGQSDRVSQPKIQAKKFENYMDGLAGRNAQHQQQQPISRPAQQQRTYAPANERYSTARGTRPHVGGQIGANMGSDFNKNLLQMGHQISPMSFMQYSLMFGAGFPLQMKMAESITAPVTEVAQKYEVGRKFAGGFTGVSEAVGGFSQQLSQSPFDMYESMYQSKILLTSALGGERQSNKAIDTALNMAREYPVKTEQVLSSLSRLAVYPQTKPYLKNEDFQKKLMESVSGLSLIVPEQGMEGAMFSLIEAMSGSQRSLQMRFNVSPEVVESLSGMSKGEMSSDPNKLIEGLHRFIGKSVGLDVLEKQKYTFSKQVDNFGDSLQMMTRNVFEQTGLYKTITAGATTFQTGFSSLAENKTFLNFIGNLTQPFQERTDGAMAKFVGMPTGLFKQSPLSQVSKVLEENFEGMSYEQIGTKFSVLIDDMGGIWKDTNKSIDKIINSAFGQTLGDIGGDIADVVGSNFQGMAMAVVGAFGKTMLQNPMDIVTSIGTLAMPVMGVIGGAQLGVGMMHKFMSEKTIGRRVMEGSDAMFGSHKFGTSSIMAGPVLNEEKLEMSMQRTASKDDAINTMLFSKGEGKDFDGKFKNRDTGQILNRIADIGDENRKTLSKTLLTTTGGSAKFNRNAAYANNLKIGDAPIPMNANQAKKFNKAIDKLTVSSLGLDARDTNRRVYNTIDDISIPVLSRSKLQKEMNVEGTDFNTLVNSSIPNKYNVARNVIESDVYDGAHGLSRKMFEQTVIEKRPAQVAKLDAFHEQNFANAEIGKITNALEGQGSNLRGAILGNVKEVKIDAKDVQILQGALGQKLTGVSELPSKAGVRAAYTKYKDTDKFKNLDVKNRRLVRKAMFRYENAIESPDGVISTSRSAGSVNRLSNVSDDMINSAVRTTDIKSLQKGLRSVEYDPNSFKHMMGVLGDEKNMAAIGGDFIKGSTSKTIGGDLLENKSFYRFVTDRQGQLDEAAKSGTRGAATMSDDVLRGGKAFRQVLSDGSIGGRLATGAKRYAPLRMAARVANIPFFQDVRRSGAIRKLAPVAAGALALADIPFSMYQTHKFAKNLGASDNAAMNYTLGTGAVSALGMGAGVSALKGTKGTATALSTKDAFTRLLGMNNAAKTAGKGFMQRGLASGAGIAGLTGVVSVVESAVAYSDSFKKLKTSHEKYSNSLLQYGLNAKEYTKLLSTGGVQGLTVGSAFKNDNRQEGGQAGIKNNKQMIGLGTGIAAIATALTGVGALAVGGAALAAGSGGTLSSYLYGTGNLSEEEQYTQQSITGFLGNRKFFTDQSRNMGKDIDYLQSKEQTTGLTFAETGRLRNLQIDKGKIDVLASATLEGAKEVSNIVSGKDSFVDQREGRRPSIFDGANSYTDEEKNVLGFVQQLDKRNNRSSENKIGAYLSNQSYVMDQYNPKVKKVFEEGSEKEIIGQSKRYAEVLTKVNAQYDDTMGSVNIKDTNQVEIMKQAKTSFIKSIQIPLGNTEAQGNVREAVAPILLKDFFKANTMSVLTEEKSMQNSYAEIAVASQNKLAQLGISDPNKLFTSSFSEWNDNTPSKFGKDFNMTSFDVSDRQDGVGGRGRRKDAETLAKKSFKGFDGVFSALDIDFDNIGTAQLTALKNLSREDFDTSTGFQGAVGDREYKRFQKGIQRYGSSPQAEIVDTIGLSTDQRVGKSLNMDFVQEYGGFDLAKGESPSSNDKLFDILKIGTARDEARKTYKDMGGNDTQFNKFLKTLETFQDSDVVGKKDFQDKSRNETFGAILKQSTSFRELKPIKRRFETLKDFEFTGFSKGKTKDINTNVKRAFEAKDTMMGLRGEVDTFVKANPNIKAKLDEDGNYTADTRAQILATDGGGALLTKYSKSADDYDKAMQVVNNATAATSEAVEGKLSQSIEKVGVLFKQTAVAGDALSSQSFTNRLKEQSISSDDAIASLRSTSKFKTAQAHAKFNDVDKDVDFNAIGKMANVGNISSMTDMMKTDDAGRTVFSKLGQLELGQVKGVDTPATAAGLTDANMQLLAKGATEYQEAQGLLPDAAQKSFQAKQKLGGLVADNLSVGGKGNPFYTLAKSTSAVSYKNKRAMAKDQLVTMARLVDAFNQTDSREERGGLAPAIKKVEESLIGMNVNIPMQGVHVDRILGQTGANSAYRKMGDAATKEARAVNDKFTVQGIQEISHGYVPHDVDKIGTSEHTKALRKAAKQTGAIAAAEDAGTLTLEQKKKKMGMSQVASYSINTKTGEREYQDKDNKKLDLNGKGSSKKDTSIEKGIKISNGGEIATLIANAIAGILGGIINSNGGGGQSANGEADEAKKRMPTSGSALPIGPVKNPNAETDDVSENEAVIARKPLTNDIVDELYTKHNKVDKVQAETGTDADNVSVDTAHNGIIPFVQKEQRKPKVIDTMGPLQEGETRPTEVQDSFGIMDGMYSQTDTGGIRNFSDKIGRDDIPAYEQGNFSMESMRTKAGVDHFKELSNVPTGGTASIEMANKKRNETETVEAPLQDATGSNVSNLDNGFAQLSRSNDDADFGDITTRFGIGGQMPIDLYTISDDGKIV